MERKLLEVFFWTYHRSAVLILPWARLQATIEDVPGHSKMTLLPLHCWVEEGPFSL